MSCPSTTRRTGRLLSWSEEPCAGGRSLSLQEPTVTYPDTMQENGSDWQVFGVSVYIIRGLRRLCDCCSWAQLASRLFSHHWPS